MSTSSTQNIKNADNNGAKNVVWTDAHRVEESTLMDCDFGGSDQTTPLVILAAAAGQNDFITSITEGQTNASNANSSQFSSSKEENSKSNNIGGNNLGLRNTKPDTKTHFDTTHNDDMSSDSDSDDREKKMPSLARRMSMVPSKNRTRLQDSPRLTPAIQRQLTNCRSTVLNRTKSSKASNEGHNLKEKDEIENADAGDSENNAHDHMPEEECDMVDEDDIPAEKKKKMKENKWLIYLQLIVLLILVAFLPLSYKIGVLSDTVFFTLHLWRWDSLILVVFCGHLLSGWVVKVHLLRT